MHCGSCGGGWVSEYVGNERLDFVCRAGVRAGVMHALSNTCETGGGNGLRLVNVWMAG